MVHNPMSSHSETIVISSDLIVHATEPGLAISQQQPGASTLCQADT